VLALVSSSSWDWDPAVEASIVTIAAMAGLFGMAITSYASLRRSEAERLRAAALLVDSQGRYQRTFENVTIGMAHLSAEGRWLRANPRLEALLGYSEEELRERTYAEVSHLDDLELDVRQWELLRQGEISDYGIERRFLTKGGEEVIADVRLVREENASGELLYVIAVIQDVTGRKISEGTLRLYERALAATQNGVVITDGGRDDHPITYVNQAFLEISGYEASDVIGKNCRFLNERARDQAALDELRRAVDRGEPCSVLLRNHRKDGEAFWNQLSIAPVRDPDGRLTHFVGIVSDASDRVRASAEREELLQSAETANRSKDRFLSVVSHELRSPLNAILAWTSLLQEAPDPAGIARAVESIEAAIRSQTRLVDDLLDASRLRVGALEVEPVLVEVVALARRAIDQLIPIASGAGLTLGFEARCSALHAMLDPERLTQIVRNLVDNGLKFTPRGGRIDVELREESENLVLEVRDSGCGIGANDLNLVFGEFWQADRKGGSGGKGRLELKFPILCTPYNAHGVEHFYD
jgi:PAS domain S-box-containing protein